MELRTFTKTSYLYVNVTNGAQYRDPSVPLHSQIDENDLPENIEEFSFTVKTVPAGTSALGADAALRYSLGRPRIISAPGQQGNPAEQAEQAMAAMNFNELLPQTEVEFVAVAESIVEWNLTKDGQPVKPSADILKNFEPAWIYEYIKEFYDSMNQIDEKMRQD